MTAIIDLALYTIMAIVIVVIVAMTEVTEVGEDTDGEGEVVVVGAVVVMDIMTAKFVRLETLAGLAGQGMKVKKGLRGENNRAYGSILIITGLLRLCLQQSIIIFRKTLYFIVNQTFNFDRWFFFVSYVAL